MANNYANRQTIPLNAFINLSKDKTQVENFDKFNRKNGTIYGGNLASFYTKKQDTNTKVYFDSKGNKYNIGTGSDREFLMKNDVRLKRIIQDNPYRWNYTLEDFTKLDNVDYKYFNYDNVNDHLYYVFVEDNKYKRNGIVLENYSYSETTVCEAFQVPIYGNTLSPYTIGARLRVNNGLYDNRVVLDVYLWENGEVNNNNSFSIILANNASFLQDTINPFINIARLATPGNITSQEFAISIVMQSGSNLKTSYALNYYYEYNANGSCYYEEIKKVEDANNNIIVSANGIDNTKFCFMNAGTQGNAYVYYLGGYSDLVGKNMIYCPCLGFAGNGSMSLGNEKFVLQSIYGFKSTKTVSKVIWQFALFKNIFLQDLYYINTDDTCEFLQQKNIRCGFDALLYVDDLSNPTVIKSGCQAIEYNIDSSFYTLGCIYFENQIPLTVGIKNAALLSPLYNLNLNKFFCITYYGSGASSTPFIYFNSGNRKVYLTKNSNYNIKIIDIIDDKYILTNQTDVQNVYNIDDIDEVESWCNGFIPCLNTSNINLFLSPTSPNKIIDISTYSSGIYAERNKTKFIKYVCIASHNNNYENSESKFVSCQFTPMNCYINKDLGNNFIYIASYYPTDAMQPNIDYYYSKIEDNLYPEYQFTKRKFKIIDENLKGLTYTVGDDVILCPCFLDKFIYSYLARNFILQGDKGYPLIQWNNDYIYAFTSLSFIENIKAVFVIQTMTYFITDKKLIYAQYSGNELVQSQFVADITGLLYLGSLYDRALFFSQYNRKIYQFTGDSILTEFLECNNIKEISAVSYIPMSNSVIFAATENDNKQVVFIMQQGNMIRLEDVSFNRIYTTENDDDSIILVSDDKIVYLNNEQYAGFTKDKLKVETCYFGIGQEQKSIFSCYYVRLYSENKLNGQIKVKTYTLTDTEEKTTEKIINVKFNDWTENGTTLFKFQPALQEATATKLYIESDFDIQNIYAEFTASGTQTGTKTGLNV